MTSPGIETWPVALPFLLSLGHRPASHVDRPGWVPDLGNSHPEPVTIPISQENWGRKTNPNENWDKKKGPKKKLNNHRPWKHRELDCCRQGLSELAVVPAF